MPRSLTASDRKNLVRLASEMPKGSPERRAILAVLKKTALDFRKIDPEEMAELFSPKALRPIYNYLGRHGLAIWEDNRIEFLEDDPYAPDTMGDRGNTISFGTTKEYGETVRVDEGGANNPYGTYYVVVSG